MSVDLDRAHSSGLDAPDSATPTTANMLAQRLGPAWLALGLVVLAGLYVSGRWPVLSGLAPVQARQTASTPGRYAASPPRSVTSPPPHTAETRPPDEP